jgi:hypothetical protein
MDAPFFITASAVLFANLLTLLVAWAAVQFYRYDRKASGLAYLAVIVPMAYLGLTVAVSLLQ